MTTTELDAVMQAAERLRRVDDPGVRARDVYGEPPKHADDAFDYYSQCEERDCKVLADFALSILPKGKRPDACTCLLVGFCQSCECPIHYPKTEDDFESCILWHQHKTLSEHMRAMTAQPIDYHR